MSDQTQDTGEQRILLGVMDLGEAKRVKSLLEERGVELELVSDPETCGAGGSCKPRVEVHVRQEDVPTVAAFLREEHDLAFDGLDVDHSLLNEVFDPEKETARCPACGTEFSTKLSECPDCGLVFSS